MNYLRISAVFSACALLGACNTTESVRFQALAYQSNIIRDGIPAIVSKKARSTVMVSPARRGMTPGGRAVFVVGVTNNSKTPFDLHLADFSVVQVSPTGSEVALGVVPYDQLVSEEKTRQVLAAVLVGVAAGANSYAASRHGGYWAQANANDQNATLISNSAAAGQQNLAALETLVLKDNTVMPGELVGGQLFISPPVGEIGQSKTYTITVNAGGDIHTISVDQELVAR